MKPVYERILVQKSTEKDHVVGVMFGQEIGKKPDTHWHHFTLKETQDLIHALRHGLESYKLGHTWWVSQKESDD